MRKSLKFGIIGCSSIADRITIPSIVESKYSILENIGSKLDEWDNKTGIVMETSRISNLKEKTVFLRDLK